jgi:hypothetical protein
MTMEWQPIETAPKDGTQIIITDGRHFTRARWWFYEEPQKTSLGYGDPVTKIPEGGWPKHPNHMWSIEQVANPEAGKRSYSWYQDNPVAFLDDDSVGADHDGNFDKIEPTHWQPLPPPPKEPQ